MNNKERELSYLILQHKYMEKYKINTQDGFIIDNSCFPNGWFFLDFNIRIEILQQALRTNQTINDIMNMKKNNLKGGK